VSRHYRAGNPPPRVHEIEAGMINSIGLPTKGLAYFLETQLPEPNAGEIGAVAEAAEKAGADALTVSNTILGLKIGTETFRSCIGTYEAGMVGIS
jgi:dihydroorotate dehydrogenase (NAD+) catalytic subunit